MGKNICVGCGERGCTCGISHTNRIKSAPIKPSKAPKGGRGAPEGTKKEVNG